MPNDYYETLQVHPKADQAAVEAAYSRLRALYDPARLEGAADELVALARQKRDDIERAYAVLGDPPSRARYDDEQAERAMLREFEADDEGDEVLDYRPLPPARRSERPKGAEAPVRTVGRAAPRSQNTRPIVIISAVLLAVALIGTATFLWSGATPGSLVGVVPTTAPTASPLDQFEGIIAQAKAQADANPNDPQAWIDYGNMVYNSVEIVREFQPDSQLYQERLPRWLQATEAYSRALALEPDNPAVRSDFGVSSCFYGAGTNNQQYVDRGLLEVQQAAEQLPDDPRVLLSLGHCLVSLEPARTPEALEAWLKVRESQPADSPLAQQAQALIQQYGN